MLFTFHTSDELLTGEFEQTQYIFPSFQIFNFPLNMFLNV